MINDLVLLDSNEGTIFKRLFNKEKEIFLEYLQLIIINAIIIDIIIINFMLK